RRKPRGRPQTWHRWCVRTENFGVRCDFRMRLFLATVAPLSRRSAERHLEAAQESARLFVRSRGRADRDLHATQPVDLVVLDLRKDQLLLEAERVIAAPVEALRSEEHTSELQSLAYLVCRLLLENKQ